MRGQVIVPGDPIYDSARLVWNRAADRHPAAIVRCADADDVRRAVEGARSRQLPLAVRSGGHSQAAFGVCDGGVVVDLSALRAIAVDRDRRVARVASGARVADVLDATLAHGLATPMGGCPDVGVGGLTLGGGENFLMATYGAVCDNVLAAGVVVADGRVLTASAEDHADLFWAIRGGGGNFGIVTWFDYQLHPVIDVLSGMLLFPISRAADTLRRYRDLMATVPDALETSGGLTFREGEPVFFLALCHCGGRRDGEAVVRRWQSALQSESDTVSWSPYSADLVVPAARSTGTGIFLPALSDEAIDALAAAMPLAPPSATATWNDFHGAVTRVPRDAMAFPLRERGFDLFISAPWEDEPGRRAAVAWVEDLHRALAPLGRGVYVNNLNADEAHRIRDAYGSQYDRLAATKAVYDPGNVFRVNHNIPPAGTSGPHT